MQLFAVAAPGLERLVADEVAALPSLLSTGRPQAVQAVAGGVEFAGDLTTIYSANLHLRCASRLLLRLCEVSARDFATLEHKIAELNWGRFLSPRQALQLDLHATAERCRLYHTGALADCVAAGLSRAGYTVQLADENEAPRGTTAAPATARSVEPAARTGAALGLWLRGEHDRFTLSIDTSGPLLHRRGWRQEEGAAPLRETLAAALCRLAGYRGDGPFCDPLCGSGTLAIEAALLARRRAAGAGRTFAFQAWPSYVPKHFAELLARAQAGERSVTDVVSRAPLYGSDHDPQVLAIARRNAERAGVADCIHFAVADVGNLRLPAVGAAAVASAGLVLCNPPYGRRIGDANLGALYRKLARLCRSAPGWRLALFSPSPELARLALRHATAIPLKNGGLSVSLYLDAKKRDEGAGKDQPTFGPASR